MGYLRLPALAATLLAVSLPTPASAITNGQPDEGRHPDVGALVSHNGKDRKPHLLCTGTLLSSTVFLTAAHCLVDEPTKLYVAFEAFVGAPDVGPEVVLHPGTAIGHPQFVDETAPGDTHDIAIVKLDPPLEGFPTGELPVPGAVAGATGYELVGYGREGQNRTGFYGGGSRRFAFGAFLGLESYKLLLNQTGTLGGTCNGDSGGPALQSGSRTVLGITSDGDPACAVNGVYYRADTASARDFLDDFIAVPQPRRPRIG